MTQTVAPPRTPQAKGGKRSDTPRIGLFRPVRVGQAALWELAALAVIATAFPWRLTSSVVAVVALVVVAGTSVRWSGLCAYQWIGVHSRFRRRPSTVHGPNALAVVVPGLRSRRQVDRAGNRAGLAEDGDGLVAVVRLVPGAEPDTARLLEVLESTVARTDIPPACAQLVVWALPSPPRTRYHGDERDTAPVRVHWLAVRYRAADAPAASIARGGGDTGAARATATAALTLARTLADAGLGGVVLDEPELRQELLVALGTDSAALACTAECSARETWRDWSIGALRQVTFRPKSAADGAAVSGRFVPGAAFTCTSYSLRRTARGPRADAVVRVGLHPAGRVMDATRIGQALGVELLPANGRHAESVVDNLPLAR